MSLCILNNNQKIPYVINSKGLLFRKLLVDLSVEIGLFEEVADDKYYFGNYSNNYTRIPKHIYCKEIG